MLVELIKPKETTKKTLYLSKDIAQFFLVDTQRLFTLSLGLAELQVRIKISNDLAKNEISISKDILKFLHVVFLERCHININSLEGRIIIGPYVGVFVNPRLFELLRKGEVFNRAQLIFNGAREVGGIPFFFTSESIKWFERRMRGITLDKNGNTKYQWFHFPKVFYDRGVNFHAEEKEYVNFIRRQIRNNENVCFVNHCDYLDKWATYTRLSKYENIKDLLPETLLYTSVEDLQTFIAKYGAVYCKGRFGSKGSSIALIKPDNSSYLIKTPYQTYEVGEPPALESFLHNFFRERPFVLQQPLEFYQSQSKKADMRVLICKDDTGTWQVVYNQVRIADKENPVTNASKGGIVEPFLCFYSNALGNPAAEKLNQEAGLRAMDIALALEQEFGSLGELGIDLALDQNLRFWFIEANSKPDTSPEPFEIPVVTGVYQQFRNLFLYTKFLEGITTTD